MKNKLLVLLVLLLSCSAPTRKVASTSSQFDPSTFPRIVTDKSSAESALLTEILQKIKRIDKRLSPEQANLVANKLKDYFLFLGLTAKDFKKAEVLEVIQAATSGGEENKPVATVAQSSPESDDEEDDKTPSNLKAIQRLFAASAQFLFCDLRDWECIEKNPILKSSMKCRQPMKQDLGEAINAGSSLDMKVYFTQAWDGKTPRSGVVDRMAEHIKADAQKSLSIAMYGIDDIKGTMKPVYDAISEKSQNSDLDLRAVIDVAGLEKGGPWYFDYVTPVDKSVSDKWLFGQSKAGGPGMHANFQYDGTPDFIRLLNGGIQTIDDSRVRIEWPASHIMHNKYAVMENEDGNLSVWTGTANVSNHCMGAETNSNMSVYIKNDHIGQAFLDEFNHMFSFDPSVKAKSKLAVGADANKSLPVGRFHHNKFPVSHRLFTFDDGTKARVFFAPTDDAEHRAILPMLLSAQAGDEIRISMFGGTGYEIIRAMQYAVAKGANIKIVYDRQLGHGVTSWIRDCVLNVFNQNPYLDKVVRENGVQPGTITVRSSTWDGKNHYKVGTLTRALPNGKKLAEQIILGSQNWSSGGNDHNDENLLAVQNLNTNVPAAVEFNKEFDSHLWPNSRPETKSLCTPVKAK